MKKYIIITGDENDGDYITKKNEIDDEDIELIKPIIAKIKENHKSYFSGELSENNNGIYDDFEGIDIFRELVPIGEYGIHTIESIEIIEVFNETKLL